MSYEGCGVYCECASSLHGVWKLEMQRSPQPCGAFGNPDIKIDALP